MPRTFASPKDPSQTSRMRGRLCAALAASIVLAGCAGPMAFRDGRKLVEEGKVEDGLIRLHQALDADPHNVEYRQTYLQTRDRALMHFLDDADRRAAGGRPADARALYQRALAIATARAPDWKGSMPYRVTPGGSMKHAPPPTRTISTSPS
jgi:general secretion pathway protein D